MIQFNVILPLELYTTRDSTYPSAHRHAISQKNRGEGNGAQPLYEADPVAGGAPPHKGGGDGDQGNVGPGH